MKRLSLRLILRDRFSKKIQNCLTSASSFQVNCKEHRGTIRFGIILAINILQNFEKNQFAIEIQTNGLRDGLKQSWGIFLSL